MEGLYIPSKGGESDSVSVLDPVASKSVRAAGRWRSGFPSRSLAAYFLRLTLEKLRDPVLSSGYVTKAAFDEAVTALEDPAVTVVAPMTGCRVGMAR